MIDRRKRLIPKDDLRREIVKLGVSPEQRTREWYASVRESIRVEQYPNARAPKDPDKSYGYRGALRALLYGTFGEDLMTEEEFANYLRET